MKKTKLCLGLSSQYGLELKKQLDLLKKTGFDAYFFEWKPELDVKDLKSYGDELGMICQSMHAPFTKMADMWEEGEKAEIAVDELLQCVETCADNQIPILVCHCFIGFGPENPNEIGVQNFKKVVLRAEELGVKIAFENTEGESYLDILMRAFKDFGHVGFCWDTGHEMCYNHSQDMTALYGGRLLCTHLNDNLGISSEEGKITYLDDLHLLPFDGIADWSSIVERLNRHGYADILTFELNTKSKKGRHENDIYEEMGIEAYIAEVYKRACKIAEMKENALKVNISEELAPAVFAVNQDYHIMMYPSAPCLMWVKVGDKVYYDEINGILRSCTTVHKVVVPMEELDATKSYTLCLRYIVDRKPYFPEIEPVQELTFEFRPVTAGKNVRAYQIADAHNWSEGPIIAAKTYGDIDFLILNGDIPDYNSAPEKCITIYELSSALTGGNIPVVFGRGNHDLRGLYAEKFHECSPTDNGKTYYTFRLGAIWGIILDCGEDKLDSHAEYGGTICCHEFREKETEFIKDVIARADKEYLADGVTHRIVICHNPFTFRPAPTFDIEDEIFREWTRLLGEHIHPDAIICGHKHYLELIRPGDEHDHRGQSCPVVIGTAKKGQEYFAGSGFEFDEKGIVVSFTDCHGETVLKERL